MSKSSHEFKGSREKASPRARQATLLHWYIDRWMPLVALLGGLLRQAGTAYQDPPADTEPPIRLHLEERTDR